MQIYIETKKIGVLRAQELCWGIISETTEAIGVYLLGLLQQLINERLHLPGAAPAHDLGGYLIDYAQRKHRRMMPASQHGPAHCRTRLRLLPRRVQETQMLVPWHIDQHL